MAADCRFSVSVHILTALAYKGGGATSSALAKSICTNAVVVRRLLSKLHQAGLVTCHTGKAGGCILARSADRITLYDVYKAVDARPPFAMPEKPENKSCQVSCHMKVILQEILDEAERALAEDLKRTTIAQLLQTVQKAVV